MNSIHEKEKKLDEALEKLNLINPQNLNLKETISNLGQQKNQLEIEKKELEIKYENFNKIIKNLSQKLMS